MLWMKKGVRSGRMLVMSDAADIKSKIDTLAASLVITDARGVIQYANQSSSAASGYAPAEIIGKAPGKLWGGHMARDFYDRFWGVIFCDRSPFVGEVHNTKKNGDSVVERMHVAPIMNAAQEVKFYVKIQPPPDAADFSREFRSKLSGGDASDFFRRLFEVSDLGGVNLVDFFESVLVEPTREKLRARGQDALLIAAAKNNTQAFDALYQKYYGSIYQHLMHRTAYNAELSADLTQDTFLQAYRYLATFTVSNASYGTYLLTIAQHVLAAHFRARRGVAHEDISLVKNLPAPFSSAPDFFDISLIKKILLELSPIEQQILLLRYESGRSVREIAEKLLKSENAVKLHLSRAREKMRQKMNR